MEHVRRPLRAAPGLFLAVALAAGALLPAPAVGAQALPGPVRLVKTIDREQVWLIAGGQRQWVADATTFQARGYRWGDVDVIAPASLYALPLRPADHVGPLLG